MPKHLLVATDFTDASDRALAAAVELAQAMHASVTLLHVVHLPIVTMPDLAYVPTPEQAARVSEAAQKRIDAEVLRFAPSGVWIATELRTGDTVDEVMKCIVDKGADMLVIGSHGRSALGATILGSAALDLLRAAEVPVLTVHGTRDTREAA